MSSSSIYHQYAQRVLEDMSEEQQRRAMDWTHAQQQSHGEVSYEDVARHMYNSMNPEQQQQAAEWERRHETLSDNGSDGDHTLQTNSEDSADNESQNSIPAQNEAFVTENNEVIVWNDVEISQIQVAADVLTMEPIGPGMKDQAQQVMVNAIQIHVNTQQTLNALHLEDLRQTFRRQARENVVEQSKIWKDQFLHLGSTGPIDNSFIQPATLGIDGDSAKIDGIGILETFPEEVRVQIFRWLNDPSFKQHCKLSDGNAYLLASSSAIPTVLNVSKQMSCEAKDSLHVGRTCEITVSKNIIAANFLLFDYTQGEGVFTTQVDGPTIFKKSVSGYACTKITHQQQKTTSQVIGLTPATFSIPSCRELVVKIQIPTPRQADACQPTRQTIMHLVDLLNSVTWKQLPPVRVTFKTNDYYTNNSYSYHTNDIELLIGPFFRLSNATCITIDRMDATHSNNDSRHRLCDAIEAAVTGTASPGLVVDQCLIDFKMYIYTTMKSNNNIQADDVEFITDQLLMLYKIFQDFGRPVPSWLPQLVKFFHGANFVSQGKLRACISELWGEKWMNDVSLWISGLKTTGSPFREKEMV